MSEKKSLQILSIQRENNFAFILTPEYVLNLIEPIKYIIYIIFIKFIIFIKS